MKSYSFVFFAILSFFAFISSTGFCQNVVLIDLNAEEIVIPNRSFFIENVIDKRLDKNHIGWIQKGMSNRRVFANLSGAMIGGMAGAIIANDLDCICLDLATGIITPLNKTLMQTILKEDQDLLKEYTQQTGNKNNPRIQLDFLRKYNERNPMGK